LSSSLKFVIYRHQAIFLLLISFALYVRVSFYHVFIMMLKLPKPLFFSRIKLSLFSMLLGGMLGLSHESAHAQQIPELEEQQRRAESFVRAEWRDSGPRQAFPPPDSANRIFRLSAQHPGRDCDERYNTENRAPELQSRLDEAGEFARENGGPVLVMLGAGCFRLEDPIALRTGRHDGVYLRGDNAPDWAGYSPESETRLELHFRLDARKFTMGQLAAFTLYGYDAESIPLLEFDLPNRLQPAEAHQFSTGDVVLLSNQRDDRGLMFGEMNIIGIPPRQMMGTGSAQPNAIPAVATQYPADLTLRRAADSNSRMQLTPITPLREAGIGFLRMDAVDIDPDGTQLHHILISQAVDIQVHEVVSSNTPSRHITLYRALHTGVRNSFFDGTQHITFGRIGAGYGVLPDRKSTLSRIENNAFQGFRVSVSLARGSTRNVIGYNFSRAPRTPGDMRSRNRQDSGNLFEGNILSAFHADTYHVGEDSRNYVYASENVLLRNLMTSMEDPSINLEAGNFTFLGNEANPERANVAEGVELNGFYTLYENRRPVPPLKLPRLIEAQQAETDRPRLSRNTTPAIDTAYLPYRSFYLDAAPAFYTTPAYSASGLTQRLRGERDLDILPESVRLPWPSIGPPVSPGRRALPQHNPAYLRYCQAFPDICDR
jgi:hypothetical protein